ncbi:MAG: D-Ala-D-Ala carboxypeptidase family metallohydrolase [Sandaracinobacter sp.]
MNLSPNFTLAELTRSQAAARLGIRNVPDEAQIEALRRVCQHILEPVRAHFRMPVIVSSGFRSVRLNTRIGGSRTSQHAVGEAVDFEVPGVPNIDVARWIEARGNFDQLILEFYTPGEPNSGWVHCSWKLNRLRRLVLTKQAGRSGYLPGLVA